MLSLVWVWHRQATSWHEARGDVGGGLAPSRRGRWSDPNTQASPIAHYPGPPSSTRSGFLQPTARGAGARSRREIPGRQLWADPWASHHHVYFSHGLSCSGATARTEAAVRTWKTWEACSYSVGFREATLRGFPGHSASSCPIQAAAGRAADMGGPTRGRRQSKQLRVLPAEERGHQWDTPGQSVHRGRRLPGERQWGDRARVGHLSAQIFQYDCAACQRRQHAGKAPPPPMPRELF